jgi:hypothetical protein
MIIVYRDQDQEWWVEEMPDKPRKVGPLESLPDNMADKIVALQHVRVKGKLDGVGVRVGEHRFWLDV